MNFICTVESPALQQKKNCQQAEACRLFFLFLEFKSMGEVVDSKIL